MLKSKPSLGGVFDDMNDSYAHSRLDDQLISEFMNEFLLIRLQWSIIIPTVRCRVINLQLGGVVDS